MSRRAARAIAWGILLLCLAAAAASIPVRIATRQRIEPGQIIVVGDRSTPRTLDVLEELRAERAAGNPLDGSTGEFSLDVPLIVLLLLLWIGVGALIVTRQPTNWAGWLFIVIGVPIPVLLLVSPLVVYGLKADPGSIPLIGLWATIGEYGFFLIALLPLLFLLYPDGHLPSPRWRWAVVGLVGGTAVALLGFLFRPGPFNNWIGDGILYVNPLGIDGFAGVGPVVIFVGTVIALAAALSTVIAVRQRYRRSSGDERQRMRWLAFVASLAGVFFVLEWVVGLGAELFFPGKNDAPVFEILFLLTAFILVVGVPTAYLIAIFRHGLWELDVVIRKAVVAIVVAVLLSLVAVVIIGGLGALAIAGGDVTNAAVVGVVLGLLAPPVVRLARRVASRLVYGKRATPYEVLTEFSGRVGETYSTEDVLPRMARILAEATGASPARIWLRLGGELRPEASWPAGAAGAVAPIPLRGDAGPTFEGAHGVEVRHQGEMLGALTVEMPANDPMNPAKEKLVRDLAAQAGLVLRNVRLIEELRASRQRLVAAQDEERMKIERNIHDGAQQQLVALSVQLRLAEQMVGRDPDKERELLERLGAATTEALEDLRDLARGIYPPLLADQGLAAALQAQARKAPVPVTVESDGVGRYPHEVEAAVYFCSLEALNNVAKYADASRADIRLRGDDSSLTFEVADDGRGFDPSVTGHGTGLQGMADRMDALGGTIEVRSAPGEGTTVLGRVPVPNGEPAG